MEIETKEINMALKTIRFTKEEMNSRVARFNQLQGFDGGLPDSKHPDSIRTLFNVIGFQPPENHDPAATSPVGSHAVEAAAIKISEGFNLGYCKAKPGKGPMMHNHDTNETFIPMTGKWRCSWEVDNTVEYYEVEPLDVVSFPAGVQRRFENITFDEPDEEHILMVIIGGNAPQAEFSPEAMEELSNKGLLD